MLKREMETIKVFALGGLGEIGKNMYVVEVGNDIFVIDAGVKFPEDDMFGIDTVIPDTTYLFENRQRIKGVFLTHGHEDHIGGLPYIIENLQCPVYGTTFTLGIVKDRLKQTRKFKKVKLKQIDADSVLKYENVTISFFHITHNIPGSIGICIHTLQGNIVHTGDFKIDQTPVDGEATELQKLSEIGRQGTLCLMSDSTNAEVDGYTPSEKSVGEELHNLFHGSKERIIVASEESNLHRIQQIFDAAYQNNRKVAIIGKGMIQIIETAINLDYLNVHKNVLISPKAIDKWPDERIVILATGNQLDPLSVLCRMAKQADKFSNIKQGDQIILAINPHPGAEKFVSNTIDLLYRAKANVIAHNDRVHVSGHASREELKLMIELLKPKYLLPVHGEYRMQHAHANLAKSMGMASDQIFVIENGEVIEFKGKKGMVSGKVPSGNTLVDGLGIGDIGNIVLRDRRLLSRDGILIVVVTLDKEKHLIASGPEILSRGFVYVRESEKLLEEATRIVNDILQKCMDEYVIDWSTIKTNIRESLSHFLFNQTKRRPMILPIIMEI